MKIAVLGTGYVGLVSGVCLSSQGHDIVCVDIREAVVEMLNRGQAPIHEPKLPELLAEVLRVERFRATLDLEDALADAELVLIAVGTPSTEGRIDLRYVREAAIQIGRYLKGHPGFLSVVVKSTVVPATTDTIVKGLIEEYSGRNHGDFGLGMNPEFLREGNAVEDFLNPDRIVFGCEDVKTRKLLEELYAPWACDKIVVNTRTAEMIKYANNCLLAAQISAVNELANVCFELGGIDVQNVMQGVHLDKRWSPILADGTRIRPEILSYLVPGCGFGGSCFPKDVQAMRTLGRDSGLPMQLLQAVLDINEEQPLQVVRQLESSLGDLRGRRILLLGLAFKPDTDDLRESASLRILRRLIDLGADVAAHDPAAMDNAKKELDGLPARFVPEWAPEVSVSAAIIVATRWPHYRELAGSAMASSLRGKVLVDARRMFAPPDFPDTNYLTIGRRIPQDTTTH